MIKHNIPQSTDNIKRLTPLVTITDMYVICFHLFFLLIKYGTKIVKVL